MNKDKGVVTKDVSQPLVPNKRCSKPVFGIKPNICKNVESHIHKIFLTKNLESYFCSAVQSADPGIAHKTTEYEAIFLPLIIRSRC